MVAQVIDAATFDKLVAAGDLALDKGYDYNEVLDSCGLLTTATRVASLRQDTLWGLYNRLSALGPGGLMKKAGVPTMTAADMFWEIMNLIEERADGISH